MTVSTSGRARVDAGRAAHAGRRVRRRRAPSALLADAALLAGRRGARGRADRRRSRTSPTRTRRCSRWRSSPAPSSGTPSWSGVLRGILEEDGPAARAAARRRRRVRGARRHARRAPGDAARSLLDDTPGTGVPVAEVRAELLARGRRRPGRGRAGGRRVGGRRGHRRDAAGRTATRLLRIAATDLTSADPLSRLPGVAAALADLAGAALEAALALARADLDDHGLGVRLAVIGMGKCGGRELNYVSDVDVIYVAEPVDGVDEAEALRRGARLAAGLARVCSTPSGEPALWPVDAALRPEGKDGPLVRTIASHKAYYERWAKTWEFQALLKARPLAGDRGARARVRRDDAAVRVERRDARALRRGLAGDAPAGRGERARRGGRPAAQARGRRPAGRRVHGAAAAAGARARGRVDPQPEHADRARRAGRGRLRRARRTRRSSPSATASCACWSTGSSSTGCAARTSCRPPSRTCAGSPARSACGPRAPTGCSSAGVPTRREVRGLHEELFYRPLLPATAQLSTAEASLAPGGRQGPARGHRLPRPGGRHAPHRGADRGGVAARVDPAPAAARDARLVRGRRRPRRRPAGVPPAVRRAGHHALVPQAAPRLGHGGPPARAGAVDVPLRRGRARRGRRSPSRGWPTTPTSCRARSSG